MVSIIQDLLNHVAIPGLPTARTGLFTLKIVSNCGDAVEQEVAFIGDVCDRTLIGTIEHSCTDHTKLHLDIGTYIYELYQDGEKIKTNNITIYKNK